MKVNFITFLACLFLIEGILFSQVSNDDCKVCHEAKIEASVHGKIGCLNCHLIKELPHEKPLAKVNCLLCHKDMKSLQEMDPHQIAIKQGRNAPGCTLCHGKHDIYPTSSTKSILHPKNIETFCNTCHMNVGYTAKYHVAAIKNSECTKCHNMQKGVYLPFDIEKFNASIHNKHYCVDCHRDITLLPHSAKLNEVNCGTCHQGEAAVYKTSVHGKAKEQNIKEAAKCWDCHSSHYVLPPSNPQSSTNKLSVAITCGKCHSKPSLARKYNIPIKNPFELYQKSIHLKALINGLDAPTCVNCHGSHNIIFSRELISSVNKSNIPQTCSKCHLKAYQEYTASDHWRAFLMGIKESPVCNDCHLEHSIQSASNTLSSVHPLNIPITCSSCHESQRIIERYGIASMRLYTYESSYHGLALKAGNLYAANCSSCHDHHKILSSTNPESKTNPKNLAKTCGKCHPGISETKPIGKIHSKSSEKKLIFQIVTKIYIYLIIITIGTMILYCLLDFQKKARSPNPTKISDNKDYYIKFNLPDRLIHLVHLISFTILVYTGFAHHYPDSLWAKIFTDTFGENFRALIHRIAGSIMLLAFILQIILYIFTKHGKKQFKALIPKKKDFKDALDLVLFNLGIINQKPTYEMFSFIEKFEYWALVWGNIIMGITGLSLWFENFTLSLIPKWWLDLFILIHFYEAILATLAILVWHLYWTVFDPEVYPFAKSIWIGKSTLSHLKK